MNRIAITLFGSSATRPGEPLYESAARIGGALADADFDLINGGHEGTMEAASRAARERGARVIGVTCKPIRGARGAVPNRYLHEVIDAPTLFARIEIMMRRAGGYIVMEGGTGTLAELSLVWEHVSKGMITPRPIVCLGDHWRPIIDCIASSQSDAVQCLSVVDSTEQALGILGRRAIEVDPRDRSFGGRDTDLENEDHG